MTTASVRRPVLVLLLAAGLAGLAFPALADPWRDDGARLEPAIQDTPSSEPSSPPSSEPSPPPPPSDPPADSSSDSGSASPPSSPPEPADDDSSSDSGTGGSDGSPDSDHGIGKIPGGGGDHPGNHDHDECDHEDHGHGGHGHGGHGHHDCDLGYDPAHDLGSAWGGSYDDTESADPGAAGLTALDTDVVPESAEIWLDGERVGTADDFDGFPDYLWLPPGPHDLLLYKPGYRTIVGRIVLDHGIVNVLDDRMVKGRAMPPGEIFRSRGRR